MTTHPQQIDRYQIIGQLGKGGMGAVYRGKDPVAEREVAIKVLPAEFQHNDEFKRRFQQEARIIARLEHYAIVPLYDFGTYEGQPYMVMRLLPGGSLEARLKDGPLSLPAVNAITQRICAALDKAHASQIIHRDLKPSNILFDDDGLAYLADFGIARLLDQSHTMTFAGTARYMSPEQTHAQPVDARTDIYQMGVVLFEMLTGRVPFDASDPASILHQHAYTPPPAIAEFDASLPPILTEIVRKAMAKQKEHRYRTAGELATAIATAATSAGATNQFDTAPARTEFSPIGPAASDKKSQVRWLLPLGVVGVIACLLVTLLLGRSLLGLFDAAAENTPAATTEVAGLPQATDTPGSEVAAATDEPTPSPAPTEAPSETPVPPTPTLEPTPEPTPTSPFQVVVALEDFSSNTRDWPVREFSDDFATGSDQFVNGSYRMDVTAHQGVTHRSTNFSVADFAMTVEATTVELEAAPGNAEFVFTFRDDEAGNYYSVELASNGFYAIYRYAPDDWFIIQDFTLTDAYDMSQGNTNSFTVVALGSDFAVYANDQLLTTFSDSALPDAGAVGLGVGLVLGGESIIVDFDNFVLRTTE